MVSEFKEKLVQSLLSNDTLHFSPDAALDQDEKWLVSLGSPGWAFAGDYIDDFKSMDSPEELDITLGRWWGITDADSYRATIERLIAHGQRDEFQPFVDVISTYSGLMDTASLARRMIFGFLPTSTISYYHKKTNTDYKLTADELGLSTSAYSELLLMCIGYGLDNADMLGDFQNIHSALIWDAVRAVNVSRMAYSRGLVSREEAKDYARQLKPAVQQAYDSWRDAAAAYVLTATLWQTSKTRMSALNRTVSMLLDEPKALINQTPFK